MIHSTDAIRGARFMSADIKDYFLATPMARAEYMKVEYELIPQDIIDKYELHKKSNTKQPRIYPHQERNVWSKTSGHPGI